VCGAVGDAVCEGRCRVVVCGAVGDAVCEGRCVWGGVGRRGGLKGGEAISFTFIV
jgi:hypothetical protein